MKNILKFGKRASGYPAIPMHPELLDLKSYSTDKSPFKNYSCIKHMTDESMTNEFPCNIFILIQYDSGFSMSH